MTLKAIVHEAEDGGYWAEVPALPGCLTQAESLREMEVNLQHAIEGWLLANELAEITAGGMILEVTV